MSNRVTVIGVYPIDTDEPVYLIELDVEGVLDEFDFDEVTQVLPDVPRSDWQAAYDEQILEQTPNPARYAFFFHYLDPLLPLLTSFGPVQLPIPIPVPLHLANVAYEPP